MRCMVDYTRPIQKVLLRNYYDRCCFGDVMNFQSKGKAGKPGKFPSIQLTTRSRLPRQR